MKGEMRDREGKERGREEEKKVGGREKEREEGGRDLTVIINDSNSGLLWV